MCDVHGDRVKLQRPATSVTTRILLALGGRSCSDCSPLFLNSSQEKQPALIICLVMCLPRILNSCTVAHIRSDPRLLLDWQFKAGLILWQGPVSCPLPWKNTSVCKYLNPGFSWTLGNPGSILRNTDIEPTTLGTEAAVVSQLECIRNPRENLHR